MKDGPLVFLQAVDGRFEPEGLALMSESKISPCMHAISLVCLSSAMTSTKATQRIRSLLGELPPRS